jgi:benzoyl-CoA reductase subunit C
MTPCLSDLLSFSDPSRPARHALQWKAEGKKVVGLLCSYVPEEIVHAAGMLPWRITGTRQAATPNADVYRPPHTCLYCNHVLESLLMGEYEFLDAVVATSWDQDLVRLWDVWKYLGKNAGHTILHLPLSDTRTHRKQFAKEVKAFFQFMQGMAGRPITPEELLRSIELYDEMRALLHRIYAWRRHPTPVLSGADVLTITLSCMRMAKEAVVDHLRHLVAAFEQDHPKGVGPSLPRILVSSDRLDDPELIRMVEEAGCVVAMDDLDTGSRYFWNLTGRPPSDRLDLDSLLEALADRYHSQPASPCMLNWDKQVAQIARWVEAFGIHGVLELPLMYSRSRQMRAPYFKKKLNEMGIPTVSFEREYHLSNIGQLRTRVSAFIEMIQ